MSNSLYLGAVSGIRIFVHWTFLILIGWIVFSNLSRGAGSNEVLWSVLFVLTIFGCVTLHELGHALAAQRYRIKTRSITLLPIGGVAQMESLPEKPGEELVVALAGPAVNLVIFALLYLAMPPADADTIARLDAVGPGNFWYALMFVNLWLALFNLIPAFPMDGGRVFRALLSFRMDRPRATRIAANLGKVLAGGFALLGLFSNPFLVFIGLFIFLGAESEARQTVAQSLLRGYAVRDALLKEVPAIAPDATVRMAAERLLEGQNKYFMVGRDGRAEGVIGRDEIIGALGKLGAETPVSQVMRRQVLYLSPDLPIEAAWKKMQEQDQPFALVAAGDELRGALDLDNITEFILIRSAEQTS